MTTQEAKTFLEIIATNLLEDSVSEKDEKLRELMLKEYDALDMAIETMERKCSDCSRRKFYQIGFEAGKRDALERVLERLEELKMAEYDDSDEEPSWTDVEDWYDNGESAGKYRAYHNAIEIIKEEVG